MTPPSPTPLPLALSMGDAAGIGPEIILRAAALQPQALRGVCVAADAAVLHRAAALHARAHPNEPAPRLVQLERWADALALPEHTLGFVQACEACAQPPAWGRVHAQAGHMAAQCITQAAQAVLRGQASALVTAPIHKEALALAGVPHPGHTEMLQALAAQHLGLEVAQLPVRMMLENGRLRVVLHSIHLSLRRALDALTTPALLETLHIAHQALAHMLSRAPRLAVAALNPHAGEGGLFGNEEALHIAPAIAQARAQGIAAQGPLPPDTVFMSARAQALGGHPQGWDAVIALYHDQGLIPLKYEGLEHGVNLTLGLPLVRTSPDHGTAFDLAGSAQASPQSLLHAIAAARRMARQAQPNQAPL